MTDETQEALWAKVYDKFYTPEEQEAWKKEKAAWSEDMIKDAEVRWSKVIAQAETLVAEGAAPDSKEARAVVDEWRALTDLLTNSNPALAENAGRLYDNLDEWPKDGPESPVSKAVWAFVTEASRLHPKQ